MRRIKPLTEKDLKESMKRGGCAECRTSPHPASTTSDTVGNRTGEKAKQFEMQGQGNFQR